MRIHRDTASKYLNGLEKMGIMKSLKIGRSKFFVHEELFDRLREGIKFGTSS